MNTSGPASRAVLITASEPEPRTFGKQVVLGGLLDHLCRRLGPEQVHVVLVSGSASVRPATAYQIHLLRKPTALSQLKALLGRVVLPPHTSLQEAALWSTRLRTELADTLAEIGADLQIWDTMRLGQYAGQVPRQAGVRQVLYADDLFSKRYASMLERIKTDPSRVANPLGEFGKVLPGPAGKIAAHPLVYRPLLHVERRLTARSEDAAPHGFDATVLVNPTETTELTERSGSDRVRTLLPLLREPGEATRRFAGLPTFVFLGGLDFPPNRDGLTWFLRNCRPAVLAAVPDFRLLLVGRGCEVRPAEADGLGGARPARRLGGGPGRGADHGGGPAVPAAHRKWHQDQGVGGAGPRTAGGRHPARRARTRRRRRRRMSGRTRRRGTRGAPGRGGPARAECRAVDGRTQQLAAPVRPGRGRPGVRRRPRPARGRSARRRSRAVVTALLLLGVGVVAVAFVVVALSRPVVALLVLVATDVANLNAVVADQVGFSPYRPQLALALVLVGVLAARRFVAARGGSPLGHDDGPMLRWSPVMLGVLILYAGFAISLIGSDDPSYSATLLAERLRDVLYLVAVVALMQATHSARRVAAAAVLVLAALAGLTVVHEFVLGNQGELFGLSRVPLVREGGAFTARHAGTSSDVNFWARILILIAPLGLSLWASSRGLRARWLWAGCLASLSLGVYLTQSRGGFLALFVAAVVWLFLAGGRYRRSIWMLGVAVVVIVPLSGIGSRLSTLTDVVSGSAVTSDPSVETRKRLQVDALRMFADSPVNGHGIGTYGTIFPRYDRLADYSNPVDIVVAAHNFYLEQAADGGVVLLLAWVLFLGSIAFCSLRTRLRARASGDQESELLAVGVLAGLSGWVVASVFLHLSDLRGLLLIAGLAAVVDLRARNQAPGATVLPATQHAPAGTARKVAVTAVFVLGAAGLAALFAVPAVRWANSATMAVLPAAARADAASAYQLDVISRGVLVPTLAAACEVRADQRGSGGRGRGRSSGRAGRERLTVPARRRVGRHRDHRRSAQRNGVRRGGGGHRVAGRTPARPPFRGVGRAVRCPNGD